MTREEVRKEVLSIPNSHVLLELPTSFGKTKLGLDRMVSVLGKKKSPKILIVIPRLVLVENWKDEFKKWKLEHLLKHVTFSTYVSVPKHVGKWDVVIFDECHHLSERCQEALEHYSISHCIALSATVKKELKGNIQAVFPNIYCYKVSMKEAIDEGILPDPRVYLIPLTLATGVPTETIIKNPKGVGYIETSWATRWSVLNQKKFKVTIYCTQQQYMEDLDKQIEWFKGKYMRTRSDIFKNKWLKLCGDRLKWLSSKKNAYMKTLLDLLDKERTLTFCSSIEQTEELGENCINSKNKTSSKILQAFNEGKVNHITACNMLNEGMNLVNCRVGLYANLNSAENIIKQRLGRILRHEDPIIVIPYYKGTREEELVKTMLEDYNPKLVTVVNSLNELKL